MLESRDRQRPGGPFCSAVNCRNAKYKESGKAKHFYRFPLDETRCREWVQNCRREDLLDKKTHYLYAMCKLCSDHFETNQFTTPERKRLIWNAVPTIFDIPSSMKSTIRKRLITIDLDKPQPERAGKKKKRRTRTSADSHREPVQRKTRSSEPPAPKDSDKETPKAEIRKQSRTCGVKEKFKSDRTKSGGEYCSAISCRNARNKRSCAGKSFFQFPFDPERRRKWVENVGRMNLLKLTPEELRRNGYKLCSDHFEEDQFNCPGSRQRLKWNAVPTVFSFPSEAPSGKKTIHSLDPEEENSRQDTDTRVTQTQTQTQTPTPTPTPVSKSVITLTAKEVDLLRATKKTSKAPLVQVVQLNSVTRKVSYVPVKLPEMPEEPSSGLDCRQSVLQSSGLDCRQSVLQSSGLDCRQSVLQSSGLDCRQSVLQSSGQDCRQSVLQSSGLDCRQSVLQSSEQSSSKGSCLLSRLKPPIVPGEALAQSSLASNRQAVVKDNFTQCCEEQELTSDSEMAVDEGHVTQDCEETEGQRAPQEFAVLPEEVKMEPDTFLPDSFFQIKTEPLDS